MKVKKIIFTMGHPAHFHLFKNVIYNLLDNEIDVKVVITEKDILEKLLIHENIPFDVLARRKKNENLFDKFAKLTKTTKRLLNEVKKNKPDLLVGCMSQMGYISLLKKIPSIFCAEDDINCTFMQYLITAPFVSTLCVPNITNVGIFKYKRTSYNSYHELAYLHPNHFIPKKKVVEKYFSIEKPYFILRFANLKAYHDIGVTKGINTEIAQKLVDTLKPYGNIFITSERKLEPQFEQYRIQINAIDIHHVLAFATLYVGDSQTMAAESGVLGVPFVRFNDFVGRIGYLRDLEDVYQLGYGIKTNETDKLIKTIEELLSMPNRNEVFQKRREIMLNDKIDYAAFLTWFIENYPKSVDIMKENPDYQYKFK